MTTVSYKTGVIEVAPNVYAFIQENCATNAGFIVSEEGVLVIDSLMTPTLAGKLYSAIRNVTTSPYPLPGEYPIPRGPRFRQPILPAGPDRGPRKLPD